MIIYVEYAIIDNFIIDYLLLKATFTVTCKDYKKPRLMLCAVFGALITLLLPFIEKLSFFSVLIKLCVGAVLVLWANSFYGKKEYFLCFFIFSLFTFVSGGAITFIYSLLFPQDFEISVALVFVPCYLVIKLSVYIFKTLVRKSRITDFTTDVGLFIQNKEYKLKGFIDTGNGLYYDGKPVIILNKKIGLRLISENTNVFLCKPLLKIRVFTVAGESSLNGFTVDKIKIYSESEENIIDNVTVCVSDKFMGSGYDVILHPALLKNKEADYDKRDTQKVS